jgi:hypothetical protein
MKNIMRVMFILLVLLTLTAGGVYAASDTETPSTSEPSQPDNQQKEEFKVEFKKILEEKGRVQDPPGEITVTPEKGPVASATISGGSVENSDAGISIERADELKLRDGRNVGDAKDVVISDDDSLHLGEAETFTWPEQSIVLQKGSDVNVKPNGDFTITKADSLQFGTTSIIKGNNIKFENGILTASKADSTFFGDDFLTNLNDLNFNGKNISVGKADQIKIKKTTLKDVKDTTILTKDNSITIFGKPESNFQIIDPRGRNVSYIPQNKQSEIEILQDPFRPTYKIKNVKLVFVDEKTDEIVFTNGTMVIETNNDHGIVKIIIDDVSGEYCTNGDIETDFCVEAPNAPFELTLKKTSDQVIDATCNDCMIVDILNNKMVMDGSIIYKRSLFTEDFSSLSPTPEPIFTSNNGKAFFTLDKKNKVIQELEIVKDAPPYYTKINNFVAIHELETEEGTHRFAEIDEQVNKLSTVLIKSYTTSYSASELKAENNGILYTRDLLNIAIMPSTNLLITNLLKDVQNQRVLFLSIFLVMPLLYWLKKGQISIAIVFGLVILLLVLIFFVFFSSIQQIDVPISFERSSIQEFMNDCLTVKGIESLKHLGLQGGYIDAIPSFTALHSNYLYQKPEGYVPTIQQAEKELQNNLNKNFPLCAKELERSLPGTSITIKGETITSAILRDSDVIFSATFPFTATKVEQEISFTEFTTTTPADIRLSLLLQNAQTMVESQQNNDDLIDLDALEGDNVEIVFFPYENSLATVMKDYDFKAEDPYFFVFGNKR